MSMPRIETLLQAAHRDLAALRERHGILLRSGISGDHLADATELMAFALLGDHERATILQRLRPQWTMLQSKGLAHGAIDNASTPELRLLDHALPHTEAIDDVWHRLANATEATEPPPGALRCVTRVRGLWGQLARLHFAARDILYLLISPDPIFGLQSALVAATPSGDCAGSFAIPIDNGSLTIALLGKNGAIYRHVVQAMVIREAV